MFSTRGIFAREFLMSTKENRGSDQIVFRRTHGHTGRHVSITPDNSSMKHLAYGRIILNAAKPNESFSTGDRETGLVVLSGNATVTAEGKEVSLGQYDAIYIPRDSSVKIATSSSVDIAEFSADVSQHYPFQVVRFSQVENDPGLKFTTGGSGSSRKLHMLLAKNIDAGRLVAGFTISEPGNWTSWPPHEHAATREELYLFFDMPRPGFGTQFIYSNLNDPEFVQPVYEDDAVTIVEGYHPNVAAPGYPINFCWILCSLEDDTWRSLGGVNVQPGFEAMPTGLR
jgi:5-deoxy-glucuronate isomerase